MCCWQLLHAPAATPSFRGGLYPLELGALANLSYQKFLLVRELVTETKKVTNGVVVVALAPGVSSVPCTQV